MPVILVVGIVIALGVLLIPRTALAYINKEPYQIEVYSIGNGFVMRKDAALSFINMQANAKADGIDLVVDSAFRTMAEQESLWAQKQAGTFAAAVARPGTSNHQSGIAVDIDTQADKYGKFQGPIYEWLQENAFKYGFNNAEGARVGEPWHWVYEG